MSKAESHRFVGSHPEDLESGKLMIPGEYYKLTEDELKSPHNARFLEEGLLIPATPKSEKQMDKDKAAYQQTESATEVTEA